LAHQPLAYFDLVMEYHPVRGRRQTPGWYSMALIMAKTSDRIIFILTLQGSGEGMAPFTHPTQWPWSPLLTFPFHSGPNEGVGVPGP